MVDGRKMKSHRRLFLGSKTRSCSNKKCKEIRFNYRMFCTECYRRLQSKMPKLSEALNKATSDLWQCTSKSMDRKKYLDQHIEATQNARAFLEGPENG